MGEYFIVYTFFQITFFRVAEYATRDEAQNAINTLSNQTLMGRMVYVREVLFSFFFLFE